MRYMFLRFPGGKDRAVTFSYDDARYADKRLAGIFDKYGMKGTFNINSDALRPGDNFSPNELKELFLSKGHEIAAHGAFHRANGKVRTIEGIRDVLDCRLELEKKLGIIIKGFAYPDSGITAYENGASYGKVRNYLSELDVAYARTLGGDNDGFSLPDDWYCWMPTAHHDNPKIMEYIDRFISLDIENAYEARREARLFYIWGHSYEFDDNNNWEHIENICGKFASASGRIWFATNIEIYNYVQAYNSLSFSADGLIIYNPTLYEIWFDRDGILYSVKPGETLRLSEDME